VGTVLLGMVTRVESNKLLVSLPHGLNGSVSVGQVSDYFNSLESVSHYFRSRCERMNGK